MSYERRRSLCEQIPPRTVATRGVNLGNRGGMSMFKGEKREEADYSCRLAHPSA